MRPTCWPSSTGAERRSSSSIWTSLILNHPDIRRFTTIWTDTLRDGAFGLNNTNKLIRFYQGATGLKTGSSLGSLILLRKSAVLNTIVSTNPSREPRSALSLSGSNDYYFPTITALYLKISRGIITFLTVFLTPLFLLFMQTSQKEQS